LHNNKLAATVIFYGSPELDPQVLKNLPGPVLGIFGGADQSISVDDVNAFDAALTEAKVQHEITIYDGQPHAFVKDVQGIEAGGAQGDAWDQMLRFLDVNLKNKSSFDPRGQAIVYSPSFPWKYYSLLAFEHAFGTASEHGH
jgi:carboxymethylenebutenolidase